MRELALFAGAGGGILGGHLLGWKTVCAVEIEAYPREVLLRRQRDGLLSMFPIWDDVRTFEGKPWRGRVDIVTGGFPCQDISAAGRGEGITGEKSGLWKEMARIIGEVRPRFALVENNPMLTSRGLGTVLGDLASFGYDAVWDCIPASAVGAPHRRDRIWILAYTDKKPSSFRGNDYSDAGQSGSGRDQLGGSGTDDWWESNPCTYAYVADSPEARTLGRERISRNSPGDGGEGRYYRDRSDGDSGCKDVADPSGLGWGERRTEPTREKGRSHVIVGRPQMVNASRSEREGNRSKSDWKSSGSSDASWWSTEPALGRVAHGVADRVDRLAAIGNGQVPAVVVRAWETLNDLYRTKLLSV